jgi:peptide deformylase
MYLSQANLACVESFVYVVKKRKKRKTYLLLMNPKIISSKSTSV